MATYKLESDALINRAICNALYIVCSKVTKEWREISEEVTREVESF